MKTQQKCWTAARGWQDLSGEDFSAEKSLILAFGERHKIIEKYTDLRTFYPKGDIVMCSTAGEIIGTNVSDGSVVVTAIAFERTTYEVAVVNIEDFKDSLSAGEYLEKALPTAGLRHIFVLSDGNLVNGGELVKGLNQNTADVAVTGGLAGDAARFEQTLVGYNAAPQSGNIVAIGLYGAEIQVEYGSFGGWLPFGPKRLVTKSVGNVLFELDNQSALNLYKKYLGEKAAELPASALLFPLSVQLEADARPLVRTILSINEAEQSMTFAGDLPEGTMVQLMQANFDRLIDGAYEAAASARELSSSKMEANFDRLIGSAHEVASSSKTPQLAILISCVGRKLVLKDLAEEEVESVQSVIGADVPMIGFYSYGEISPFAGFTTCELHNQTMTVTILSE